MWYCFLVDCCTLLEKVRRSAIIYIIDALCTISTNTLFAMPYRLPTVLLAKLAVMFAVTRFYVLSRLRIV